MENQFSKTVAETVALLAKTDSQEERTEIFHNWMKSQDDNTKLRYKINWGIPHSIFNVSCKFFNYMTIQNIDWYRIWKSRDTGKWSREMGK